MKHVLCLAITVSSYFFVVGQAAVKTDLVLKANGDELRGSVVEVTDDNIRFKYSGEDVIYTFKKADIRKITFASGRTETFNNSNPVKLDSSAPSGNAAAAGGSEKPAFSVTSSDADRRNKVAILPFSFLKDGQKLPQEASDELQQECFARLSGHTGTYFVINPRSTNVLLAKAGIDRSNMIKYSMNEICKVLGVEYVIDGMVNQTNSSQSSSANTSYDIKKDDKKSGKDKVSGSTRTSTSVNQEYETFTTINIYNDKNENIYSQRRKALFSTVGAYKNTIGYLLKRTPLYSK